MVIVELQNVILHAFHGYFEGEPKIGSDYEINVKVSYEETSSASADYKNFINYAEIFDIVKQRMTVPTPLLEEVAEGIVSGIRDRYSNAKEVVISLYKLQPPISQFQGKVGITLHKHFDG